MEYLKVIEDYFGQKIKDSKTFLHDLARGPHDLIELSFYLEKKCKFRFPGDEWNTVRTVGQAIRLIESITGVKNDKGKVQKSDDMQRKKEMRKKRRIRREGIILHDTPARCARDLLKRAFARALENMERGQQ
jgi:acyl carrier protein